MGVVDEEQINEMSYVFFEAVLSELGKKLNYDAVVNYAGNSFCEKSWQMISEANPLADNKQAAQSSFANFVNSIVGG